MIQTETDGRRSQSSSGSSAAASANCATWRQGVPEIPELEAYLSVMGVEDDELADVFKTLEQSNKLRPLHGDGRHPTENTRLT